MNSSELDRASLHAQQEWNIWVIDDDPLILSLIRSVLEQELLPARLNIREFSSFGGAETAFGEPSDVDLVILDNYLGDGEGIDLLPLISSFGSQYLKKWLPVIMVSANDDQAFLARCFAEGAADYLTKPFNVSLMGYKAHAMLKAKRNQDRINEQNAQLEQLISARKREEEMASFTYDFYLRRTQRIEKGVWTCLKTPNAFSGDLLLSAQSPEGRLVFMLADATGHDLSAAISLIPVIARFHRMVEKGHRLPQLLLEINDRLLEDTPDDRFIAAVMIEVDPKSRKLHIWNGGMPPVLEITRNGEVHAQHPSQHMALGILGGSSFSAVAKVVDLSPDHWFLMLSDGLLEQQNESGERFSLELLRQNLGHGVVESMEALERAHESFRGEMPYQDDISFCAIDPGSSLGSMTPICSGCVGDEVLHSLRNHAFFDWSTIVAGPQIGQTQIPVLCGDLLAEFGVSQDLSERVFTIVTELFVNGVDHGLLKLSSELKDGPDGFFTYMQEREKRLASLTGEDQITVQITWDPKSTPPSLSISVADTGTGFQRIDPAEGDESTKFFGRGLSVVAHLSTRLDIKPPGNHLTAVLESDQT